MLCLWTNLAEMTDVWERGDYTNLNALSFFFIPFFSMYLPGAHARSPNKKILKTKLTPLPSYPLKTKKHSFAKPTNLVNLNRPVQFCHAWRACHHDLRFFLLSLLCRKNQGKFGSPFLTDILKNTNKKYFSIFRSFINNK